MVLFLGLIWQIYESNQSSWGSYNDAVNGAAQNSYFGANTTWTNTLSYDKKIGDHKINGVIGTELLQNQVNNYVSGSRNNLLFGEDPKYAYLNNTSAPVINDEC
jgi:hypothetical protein